jgi:anhydro-N-acetylmuramic acid kinase
MSGTSLDGIDAALVAFEDGRCRLTHARYQPFEPELRARLLALNHSDDDELHRAALAGNELAVRYAAAIEGLLREANVRPNQVAALGCHGQTVRHRPDLGYTIQLNSPALLAELSGITVIADFRSRDIAAGGQGAPLVPAFHAAMFHSPRRNRVIVNIGGISNLTDLPADGEILGFDCGPGNLLLDAWIGLQRDEPYDRDGMWAESGKIIPELLQALLAYPFFGEPPPKSTGRDMFNLSWLERFLLPGYRPEDIQATLLQLTAAAIADSVARHCPHADEIYLCGGGAHNAALKRALEQRLPALPIELTDALGIGADWVEAVAFAWLARQTLSGLPGNLPQVTGAKGKRILGAIYPA